MVGGSHPWGWQEKGWSHVGDECSGGYGWGSDSLLGPQPPACPCREANLGKSSSGFPLLLCRAEQVSQEVTAEEFDS